MFTLPYNITCGYFDSDNSDSPKHPVERKTQTFEIELYLEDNMYTCIDGHKHVIRKHNILIARPGHARYASRPFRTMYLFFNVEGELADMLNATPEFFMSSHPEQIRDMLSGIALSIENKDSDLLLYSRLLTFINLLLRDASIPESHSGIDYKIIQTAKRYIESNYASPIHLEDVAATVNLSPIYFHNIFSEVCGMSPHRYLTKIRIDHAKKMLSFSDASIADIGVLCGFGSQQYFTKIFKKETGLSPGKYKKSLSHNYVE